MESYISHNGKIIRSEEFSLGLDNRAFRFGDSVFETIRVSNLKVLFVEKHYRRLLRSFRLLSFKVDASFTNEYFEEIILNLVKANKIYGENQRVRISFYRKSSSDIYFVDSNSDFEFVGESYPLKSSFYPLNDNIYEIDVFREIYKSKDVISTIKSNNVLLHSIAGQMVKEKNIDNVLLINSDENISEAANANVFFVKGKEIITVPCSDGCVEGVFRSNLIELLNNLGEYSFSERSVNVNELIFFDEIFLTNSIMGIQPVDKYRNTKYSRKHSDLLLKKINDNLV